MKKVILKLDFHDDRAKHKAMKMVSRVTGIDSIAMDMKEKKMTVLGDIDPVQVVSKLRKVCRADILSVGPAKEPEKKKDGAKKEEAKKDGGKKDGGKKEEAKKDEDKKKDLNDQIADLVKLYKAYNPHMTTYYYVQSIEENPNACVIC